jgi:hypothetical protein
MLCCRKRETKHGSFLEFYAFPQNNALGLSKTLGRFKDRVIQSTQFQSIGIAFIDSKSRGIIKQSRQDILTHGSWISYGDCMKRGHYENIEGSAVFFGIHIQDDLCNFISQYIFDIYKLACPLWPDCLVTHEPYVVYHGTSQDSVKSIFENGLMPSQGMLGHAIYFGTFWKAFRFSCMTQDYKSRPGAILRCYAFWKNPVIKNEQSDKCLCSECKGLKPSPVDHNAVWSLLGDFVIAPPTATLKNEEYACLTNKAIVIDSVAHSTKSLEHHEPLHRNLQID